MPPTSADSGLMLAALYASGDHSDLIVRACDGREFRVHKCIMSSKSGFFEGACRGGFKEADTGVVEVEEDGAVIDALFRHIYDTAIEWMPEASDDTAGLQAKATTEALVLAKKLRAAADKYLVPEMKAPTDLAMINCFDNFFDKSPGALVLNYIECFKNDTDVGLVVRFVALTDMCIRFKSVLADEEAWPLLCPLIELTKYAVACAIIWSEYQAMTKSDDREAKGIECAKTCHYYADLDRVWPVSDALYSATADTVRNVSSLLERT